MTTMEKENRPTHFDRAGVAARGSVNAAVTRGLQRRAAERAAEKQPAFDHALLDRLRRHPAGAEELDRGFGVLLLAGQQHRHDADLMLDAGLADVEGDV